MSVGNGRVPAEGQQSADDLPLGRLERWMRDHLDGFRGPLAAERFEGGQSNPTYKIGAASGDYVLRRKPFGQLLPSAHAVDREYRLLAALHPLGFPAPRPLALCDDTQVIGAIFYVAYSLIRQLSPGTALLILVAGIGAVGYAVSVFLKSRR